MSNQKKKIDWQEMGQVMALRISLYTLISVKFKELKVDLGIIQWVLEGGKEMLLDLLDRLGREYLRRSRPILPVPNINLYNPAEHPSEYTVRTNVQFASNCTLEKWFDRLVVSATERKRVVLKPLSDFVKPCDVMEINAFRLDEALRSVQSANAALLIALQNESLVPESFYVWPKSDVDNPTTGMYLCFCGTTYMKNGGVFVRYMKFNGHAWERGFIEVSRFAAFPQRITIVTLQPEES